jgi:hypothetical protein
MTEEEWLAGKESATMFNWLRHRAGERKLRLFGCACCRRIWDLLTNERSRIAVEASERYADGLASIEDLQEALFGARLAASFVQYRRSESMDHEEQQSFRALHHAAEAASRTALGVGSEDAVLAVPTEQKAQAALLLDIFGNPFRPVPHAGSWRSWNDGTVQKMAQAIYDERRYSDLPILADALEDAGCADAAILAHCRTPGEHVRGCWVIDLLLGKS